MQTRRAHEKRPSIRASEAHDLYPASRSRSKKTHELEDTKMGDDHPPDDRHDGLPDEVGQDALADTTNSAEDHNHEPDRSYIKAPRLRIRVNMPKVPIEHPSHIPLPRKHPSFRDWLQHEGTLLTEDARGQMMTDEDILRAARLRGRVLDEARPGGLLDPERCSRAMPEKQDEPPQPWAHQDHLVAQALHFRKLMQQEYRSHRAAARRVGQAAASKGKQLQPKTDEEIWQEQEDANRARYRLVQRGLDAWWEQVIALVDEERIAIQRALQKARDEEALDEMVGHSIQLTTTRPEPVDASPASFDDVESPDHDSVSDEDEDADDDDNMSSSDVSTEEVGPALDADHVNDTDDDQLTVEQLRVKYAAVMDDRPSPSAAAPNDVVQGSGSLAEPFDQPVQDHQADDEHRRDHQPVHDRRSEEDEHGQDQTSITSPSGVVEPIDSPVIPIDDDALLDDSDASVDMDDDLGESDEEGDVHGSDEDDEHGDDNDGTDDEPDREDTGDSGLLGFLSRPDRLEMESAKQASPEDVVIDPIEEGASILESVAADTASPPIVTPIIASSTSGEATRPPKTVPTPIDTQTGRHEGGGGGDPSSEDASTNASPGTNTTTKPSELDSSAVTTPQSSHRPKTPVPSLLRGTLREYQHYGLDWLARLYAQKSNGILADEMGLGKTIQTIALLAHLACHHHVWGPHLIVVPTSVMLNWEMEFKKWCPGFKILTYFGTQEERRQKRKGWKDDERWNVCITSYQLVVQDQQAFKRHSWHYMVLDEAHNIKNFHTRRWKTMLYFKTQARLLLTGTPLQNHLAELWSLLFFVSPRANKGRFANLKEFSQWFRRPAEQILDHGRDAMDDESRQTVTKLHQLLRPFLLRRLKADVEKQMPAKHDHVVFCHLSKRQRFLYDEFMSRAETRETLSSGNHVSMLNCLMQLRKVCNHPDLFETRPVVTSFAMPKAVITDYGFNERLVRKRLSGTDHSSQVNLGLLNYVPVEHERLSHPEAQEISHLVAIRTLQDLCKSLYDGFDFGMKHDPTSISSSLAYFENRATASRMEELRHCVYLMSLRREARPIYGRGLVERLTIDTSPTGDSSSTRQTQATERMLNSSTVLRNMVLDLRQRAAAMYTTIQKFACITPTVVAPDMVPLTLSRKSMFAIQEAQQGMEVEDDVFHQARTQLSIAFPDRRLLQYDCGKLQRLEQLLRDLQAGGHRALIFTQMTRVLDILEQFLNIHGYRYLRLDGSTKIVQRQNLTDQFNNDPRITVFILSSRSGGLGINLTGADTVIFYDVDWNPAMDKQCQDRCHRIGQTREVNIYRLVSDHTIEVNILRKANQKQMLDDVVIQEGEFTTDHFDTVSVSDLLRGGVELVRGDDGIANDVVDRALNGGDGDEDEWKAREEVEDREDIIAAVNAEREIMYEDSGDFGETQRTSKTPEGSPREGALPDPMRAAGTAEHPISPIAMATLNGDGQMSPTGNQQPLTTPVQANNANVNGVVAQDGEQGGGSRSVQDYMIEHVRWELSEVGSGTHIDRVRTGGKSKTKSKNKKGTGKKKKKKQQQQQQQMGVTNHVRGLRRDSGMIQDDHGEGTSTSITVSGGRGGCRG